jgi:hypothetical protein
VTVLADLPANMQSKITLVGDCWEWTGSRNPKGYGSVTNGKGASMLAHRRSYEIFNGPIPDGFEVDHLCENTSCVNPAHLEAVTPEEHRRRIGHENLKPLYYVPPVFVPSPEVDRAIGDFFARIADYSSRYEAMAPEERRTEDERRHQLHADVGCRCAELEAA